MSRRVVVRADRRIDDAEQLLLRMNDDRDVGNALKLALAEAPAYREVSGFERSGAVSISCFAVADDVEAQIVVRGTRWAVYGLASVAKLRALGCVLVATDVYDNDERLPLSDRHVDVIVCQYPAGVGSYAGLVRADRAGCAPASKTVSAWCCGRSIRAGRSAMRGRYHEARAGSAESGRRSYVRAGPRRACDRPTGMLGRGSRPRCRRARACCRWRRRPVRGHDHRRRRRRHAGARRARLRSRSRLSARPTADRPCSSRFGCR